MARHQAVVTRYDSLDGLVVLIQDAVLAVHTTVRRIEGALESLQHRLPLIHCGVKICDPASEAANARPDKVAIILENVGAGLLRAPGFRRESQILSNEYVA
jgi:hypothetical protein